AQGLGQITELRAEVEALRAVVEKLVQTVSAVTPNRQDEPRAPEEAPPGGTEGVLVIETYGVSAAEEKQPEPDTAAKSVRDTLNSKSESTSVAKTPVAA